MLSAESDAQILLESNAKILRNFAKPIFRFLGWQPEFYLLYQNANDRRNFISHAADFGFFVSEETAPPPGDITRRNKILTFAPGNLYVTMASKSLDAPAITKDESHMGTLALLYGGEYLGWTPVHLFFGEKRRSVWKEIGSEPVEGDDRRFASLLGQYDVASRGAKPFSIKAQDFIRHARRQPPKRAEPTASAFSGWVFSLYGNKSLSDDDRQNGVAAEEHIRKQRAAFISGNDNDYLARAGTDWRLIHCGLRGSPQESTESFAIPALTVGGRAMRASPDLMYRHQKTGDVFIVEVKLTRLAIPSNLWPNVWAQLWCYSHIDVAAQAPSLTVIGEAWEEVFKSAGARNLVPRASVRRDPRAAPFDRFFRRLFSIYRGDG